MGENIIEIIRQKLVDNNIMNITEIWREGVRWIDLDKERGKWHAVVYIEMENSVSVEVGI